MTIYQCTRGPENHLAKENSLEFRINFLQRTRRLESLLLLQTNASEFFVSSSLLPSETVTENAEASRNISSGELFKKIKKTRVKNEN